MIVVSQAKFNEYLRALLSPRANHERVTVDKSNPLVYTVHLDNTLVLRSMRTTVDSPWYLEADALSIEMDAVTSRHLFKTASAYIPKPIGV